METLSKIELQKLITDLKEKTYLTKNDRETFLLANKLILNK